MHHEEPCGPPHGDQEERYWQPQPPPQEDHLENYLQRGSLDAEEKHALVGMIASVAQRISPSWRDYRIVRHRARTALIHYIQNIDEADIRWAHGPAREPEYIGTSTKNVPAALEEAAQATAPQARFPALTGLHSPKGPHHAAAVKP